MGARGVHRDLQCPGSYDATRRAHTRVLIRFVLVRSTSSREILRPEGSVNRETFSPGNPNFLHETNGCVQSL